MHRPADFLRGTPEATPGLVCLKESRVRSVYQVPAGVAAPGPLLLKCYRAATWWDRLASLWQRGKGWVEHRNLLRAGARGVPVVEPIAWSAARGWFPRRGYLLLPWIAGARDLSRLRALAPEQTTAALGALGRILREAHDAGVDLPDLHPGNVLVCADGSVRLVDLQAARIGAALSRRARIRGLARLACGLDGLAGPTGPAAQPLLHGYGLVAAAELVPAFRAWRRSLLRRRAGRALRSCSEFVRVGRGLIHARGLDAATVTAEQRALAATAPVKAGRRGCVARKGEVFGKRRPWRAAVRLWQAGYALVLRQVATAPPRALQRDGADGWVLTARVGDGHSAHDAMDQATDHAQAHGTARALAVAVARCHGQGLVVRDLKLEHTPVDLHAGTAFLVDLDGVRRPWPGMAARAQGRDLGRLLACAGSLPPPRRGALVRSFLRSYLRERRRIHEPCPDPRAVAAHALAQADAWQRRHPES
jgi:hypothetical protein